MALHMTQADRVLSTPPTNTPILPEGLARQQRQRERAVMQAAQGRKAVAARLTTHCRAGLPHDRQQGLL
jgi:hypothetical protein